MSKLFFHKALPLNVFRLGHNSLLNPTSSASRFLKDKWNSNSIVGVTIGNFDGMHVGHQALFDALHRRVKEIALSKKAEPSAGLLTFYPPPLRVLLGLGRDQAIATPSAWALLSFRQKCEMAAQHGFDFLGAILFNKHVASLTPEEFVSHYFVKALKIHLVVVGYDWRFGRGRKGDTQYLTQLGQKYGFEVIIVPAEQHLDSRVSSTRIKELLRSGNIQLANMLLGRRFSLTGKVCRGEQRGRVLGFPTANLEFQLQFFPRDGVYATQVSIDNKIFPSVTNVGVRPTFGGRKRVVETHLLDQSDLDLYNKWITVSFVEYLREEKKFANVEELRQAIVEDIKRAREVLSAVSFA